METPIYRRRGATRRDVIKTAAGVGLLASAGPLVHARPAHAARKTLKILQWSHFVPGLRQVVQQSIRQGMGRQERHRGDSRQYQSWPDPVARGGRSVGADRAMTSCMFLSPPSVYEQQVVDMKDVYDECEKKARQADRSRRQEHLQPQDQEIFRLLRQLRPRSGQLPLRPLGRDRHEARHLGRHPRSAARRSRTRPAFRSASASPPSSTPPWRCGRSCIRSARMSRTPKATSRSTPRRPLRRSNSSRLCSRRPRRRKCSPGIRPPTTGRCSPAGHRWCSTRSRSPARAKMTSCRSTRRSRSPRRRKARCAGSASST